MNKQPPVSVYVITYLTSEERCKILRQTCRDLLSLRYPDFEVVVSDNGGAISAADALDPIDDSRLKVFLNETNEGFTGNINRCLQHCSHDIIKPMCDDDLIHQDFLSTVVPLVDDDTFVMVDVENFALGTAPAGIGVPLPEAIENEVREPGYSADMWKLPYSNSCIPSAVIFSRNLFRDLGGFDKRTELSDWDFLIKACLHKRVVHVLQTLCYVGEWSEAETAIKLLEEPYFFPRERLHTIISVLNGPFLSKNEKMKLLFLLWGRVLWQSLRPLKHPFSKAYYSGFLDYIKQFFKLFFSGKAESQAGAA